MSLIRVFDLETTGLAPAEHEPVEIGWCDVVATRTDLLSRPCAWQVGEPRSLLVKPGRPVPPESSAIHHLIEADLADGLPWEAARRTAASWRDGERGPLVALAAHNVSLERHFLPPEIFPLVHWVDTWKCALRLWPEAPDHKNQTLRYWRNPAGLDRAKAMPPHRAGADAYVTAHLLRDMLEPIGADPVELAQLVQWTVEPALLLRVPFGKNTKGMLWTAVDDDFLDWVLQRDFDADVLFTAKHELDRRLKERKERYAETEGRE